MRVPRSVLNSAQVHCTISIYASFFYLRVYTTVLAPLTPPPAIMRLINVPENP